MSGAQAVASDAASSIEVAELADWTGVLAAPAAVARRAASSALAIAQAPPEAVVSLALADDETLRRLNRDHRAKDRPTNVLAFPDGARAGPEAGAALMLGDVVVALETATGEAARDGRTVADHLSHLVVHGVLHLLGHDHDTDRAAEEMEALERRALASIGIADPYGPAPDAEAEKGGA
ncbi:MAG: rRNA maturation RNase YbeY [Rhodospirillaceae bacterium]|jgi:probable rRNA maturation factor|nr:rRNA maturation RNase YbeY [Rhodospirillaceae bacterium]MBT6118410.1 rRNA maturation RNase YbeY [Rhodospirillaceae bacterium]